MLRCVRLLDVREVGEPGIVGAVWIPLPELMGRVYELSRRGDLICIADTGSEAGRAAELLGSEWDVSVVSGFEFGPRESGRLWSPNRFLESVAGELPLGRALDLACGSGRDSVFLADLGFSVTAVDHLPDALAMGRGLESRYLGAPGRIDWVCLDLSSESLAGRFDLAVCFFYLNRAFLRGLSELICPGGAVVVETFTTVHRERFGKPRTEAFVLGLGELPELLPEFDPVVFEEGWHGDRHTARFFGRRRLGG